MFEKKKINFWRLTFLFAGFTILTLFFLWSSPSEPKAQMMTDGMGSMMKQMHLTNVKIYDLLAQGEQGNMASSMQDMNSHHEDVPQVLLKLNFLTTAILFLSLPLIVGGAIVLVIVWRK